MLNELKKLLKDYRERCKRVYERPDYKETDEILRQIDEMENILHKKIEECLHLIIDNKLFLYFNEFDSQKDRKPRYNLLEIYSMNYDVCFMNLYSDNCVMLKTARKRRQIIDVILHNDIQLLTEEEAKPIIKIMLNDFKLLKD